MSFATDNAWPAGFIQIFEHARAQRSSLESRYHGPYDKFLNYAFGNGFKFYVAPQSSLTDNSRNGVDSIFFLIVFNSKNKPVFVLEVKDDSWAERPELRYKADLQMRECYGAMLYDCPIPHLWGISALGTSIRVYCGDKATYDLRPEPTQRPSPHRLLPPDFLANEWNLDILSQEGFDKIKEIVTDILTRTEDV